MVNGSIREVAGALFGRAIEPFWGRGALWGKHNKWRRSMLSLPDAIDSIRDRWAPDADVDADDPIFIFSAGWRSGSTLVQRLIVSDGSTLIWGEPYTHADYIGRMAESLRLFSKTFPPKEFFLGAHGDTSLSSISEEWIAHLYPDAADLKKAHHAFFRALLADPAAARGYRRWGLKECKYGIEHARYLKWLFPRSRFLFVYRNPFEAYRSLRLFGAYMRWPDDPIFTAKAFGDLWRTLLEGYIAGHKAVDGMLVRFEDLVGGKLSADDVANFAGVVPHPQVLRRTVTGRGQRQLTPLPTLERALLARAVAPLAEQLGYQPCDAD